MDYEPYCAENVAGVGSSQRIRGRYNIPKPRSSHFPPAAWLADSETWSSSDESASMDEPLSDAE
jgi:hypothetical protein